MIIKNGKVFLGDDFYNMDILEKDGKIIKVAENIDLSENADGQKFDAKGKHILPGAIDVHTHFDLDLGAFKSNDDFYTGSIAAVCGGTTSIVDHIGFGPKGCKLDHQIKVYHKKAEDKCVCDYGFHGVIQHVDNDVLYMMENLLEQGISSYKVYMTYDGKLCDGDIMKVFMRAKELDILIAIHAENDAVINELKNLFINADMKTPPYHALSRPEFCEAEAINRMLSLGHIIGEVPLYFVHTTNSYSLDYVDYFRNDGYENVFVETCPQYLLLDDSYYEREDGIKFILSPPLRPQDNNEILLDGIKNGEINVVATDHCPFAYAGDKQLGKDDFSKCPNGMPGVELRYSLMIDMAIKDRISFENLVNTCCKTPAKLFGLKDKGEIAVGKDCDLVVVDFDKDRVIDADNLHENVDYTPYQDMGIKGNIECVFLRGKEIVKDNEFIGEKGYGKFIKRERFNENV